MYNTFRNSTWVDNGTETIAEKNQQSISTDINSDQLEKKDKFIPTLFLEWRGIHTAQYARKLIKNNIRVIYTTNKIKNVIKYRQPNTNIIENSKCIYKFQCPVCKSMYIGSTKRHLIARINEHKNDALGNHART